MKLKSFNFHTLLRTSGSLAILGLGVETYTLFWFHPLSFVAFALIGGVSLIGAIGIYLLSILSLATSADKG
jgi:hypothetical protein